MTVAVQTIRLNVGCGDWTLPPSHGWVNIDEAEDSAADVKMRVPPLPFDDNTVTEIYGGHFFEHLERVDAAISG
jgi:predicted SAM-dependent methyltransferase